MDLLTLMPGVVFSRSVVIPHPVTLHPDRAELERERERAESATTPRAAEGDADAQRDLF
ncbi:hypothetical protein PSP6_540054 [Paraburkholderia tropica]|uniref:hypothetical protein n=1 Tax=Paraburkholderia tropica TaxID=92647 RepID=UPI001CACEEDF|nr:hypothetical protein [Paraburkholderia tropica]CAG9230110.1 hypothetical protein PSP6_540054 [Paraburkholderia tropica]